MFFKKKFMSIDYRLGQLERRRKEEDCNHNELSFTKYHNECCGGYAQCNICGFITRQYETGDEFYMAQADYYMVIAQKFRGRVADK